MAEESLTPLKLFGGAAEAFSAKVARNARKVNFYRSAIDRIALWRLSSAISHRVVQGVGSDSERPGHDVIIRFAPFHLSLAGPQGIFIYSEGGNIMTFHVEACTCE